MHRVPNQGSRTRWRCRCDCGNETEVLGVHITRGTIKSCGCFRAESKTVHGHYADGLAKEYRTWRGMIDRCSNPLDKRYKYYGARGITVCQDWMVFENFLRDVGPSPNASLSIDRIDNDGNYEPGNVRWATAITQMNNRRVNRLIEHGGETRTLADWARLRGLPWHVLALRLNRGWGVDRALKTPVQRKAIRDATN